jgi:hypothetical protein
LASFRGIVLHAERLQKCNIFDDRPPQFHCRTENRPLAGTDKLYRIHIFKEKVSHV